MSFSNSTISGPTEETKVDSIHLATNSFSRPSKLGACKGIKPCEPKVCFTKAIKSWVWLDIIDVPFVALEVFRFGEPVNGCLQASFNRVFGGKPGQSFDLGIVAPQPEHFGFFRTFALFIKDQFYIRLHQFFDQF